MLHNRRRMRKKRRSGFCQFRSFKCETLNDEDDDEEMKKCKRGPLRANIRCSKQGKVEIASKLVLPSCCVDVKPRHRFSLVLVPVFGSNTRNRFSWRFRSSEYEGQQEKNCKERRSRQSSKINRFSLFNIDSRTRQYCQCTIA